MKSFKRNFSDIEARVVGYLPLGPQLPGSGTLGFAVGCMGLAEGCMSLAVGAWVLERGAWVLQLMVLTVGCLSGCAPLF